MKRKRVYDEHRPMSDIQNGIKSGTYHQVSMYEVSSVQSALHSQRCTVTTVQHGANWV